MNVLVTGGAGYVGSIVTEHLLKQKHKVIVLDNLRQGHKEAVLSPAEFVLGDICSVETLEEIIRRFKINAVMHMAAETVVEFSITDPWRYFQNNVVGSLNLLEAMRKHQVHKLVFSSSAAVYGEPESTPIGEEHPKAPINAYGESKLMFERILSWYGRAYGIKHISLRYFCAAGATKLLGEDHRPETHLIPNVLKAALNINNPVSVFGTDYPTKDGSCIRDFVHVVDIAQAHLLALEKIGGLSGNIYNLGNGKGYSVLEVIKTAEEVAGVEIPVKFCPRRLGDPTTLVASAERAMRGLGWKPQFSKLEDIVESAWRWLKDHPDGYKQ